MSAVGIVENGKFRPYADQSQDVATTPITFKQATELANVEDGDSVSEALGKLSKLYAELEGKAAFYQVSTSRDILTEGTLMDGKTVSEWVNGIEGSTRVFRSSIRPGTPNWYTIATNKYGMGDGSFGAIGMSGLIFISRSYGTENNESYTIAFSCSYNNHVVWKCLNSSVNSKVIDKLRIAKNEASYQIDLHYNTNNVNSLAVSMIVGDVSSFSSWEVGGLKAVTDSPTEVSVYDIPKVDDLLNLSGMNSWCRFMVKSFIDLTCTSHIEVIKKHWDEIWEETGGFRLVYTYWGNNRGYWICTGYEQRTYGTALYLNYDDRPKFWRIANNVWHDPLDL